MGVTKTPWMIYRTRSEGPSGKCAKLQTVAVVRNYIEELHSTVHRHCCRSLTKITPTGTLYYCLLAPHMYGRCSSRTSRSWWIPHSTQRQRRGRNTVGYISVLSLHKSWWALGPFNMIPNEFRVRRMNSAEKNSRLNIERTEPDNDEFRWCWMDQTVTCFINSGSWPDLDWVNGK